MALPRKNEVLYCFKHDNQSDSWKVFFKGQRLDLDDKGWIGEDTIADFHEPLTYLVRWE